MKNVLFYLIILLTSVSSLATSNDNRVVLLKWDAEPVVVTALSIETEANVELLARIAQGEAIGEGLTGMQLVMECVLNRVESKYWPNTIEGVIKQHNQFNGYNTRNYRATISDDIWQLAHSLLPGKITRKFPRTMYWFYNPTIATNKSFIASCRAKYKTGRFLNHEYAYK